MFKLSLTLDPVCGLFITHGLPPSIAWRHERVLTGNAKRQSFLANADEFRDRFAVTSDDNGFSAFDEFEKAGELRFGSVNVDLLP